MQKAGGAFGGKKSQSSDKYTFSVKKIREGYWELVIDKPLPRGEYAFSMMSMGAGNMDGSTTLICLCVLIKNLILEIFNSHDQKLSYVDFRWLSIYIIA